MIRLRLEQGLPLGPNLDALEESLGDMSRIGKRLQGLTSYETKQYVGKIKILDLEQSAGRAEGEGDWPGPKAS